MQVERHNEICGPFGIGWSSLFRPPRPPSLGPEWSVSVIVSGCVLCRVQEVGFSSVYRQREDVSHFCGMLDGLAFLPLADLPKGIQCLRQHVPDGVEDLASLVDYFDATYVSGTLRRLQNNGQRLLLRARRIYGAVVPAQRLECA